MTLNQSVAALCFVVGFLVSVPGYCQHEASVCLVRTPDGVGSGSLVEFEGRRIILTNHHVVRHDASGKRFREATVTFTQSGKSATLPVLDSFHDADVAAIDASELEGVPALQVADDDALQGDALAYGHPRAGPMRVRQVHFRTPPNVTYYETARGLAIAPVMFGGGAISGESGGPLVTRDGRLVAIIFGSGQGQGHCAPIGPIRRLLRRVVGLTQYPCVGGACGPQGYASGRVIIERPQRPVTPVPRRPQSRDTVRQCPECDERFDKLEASLGKLANKTSDLADLTASRLSELQDKVYALEKRPGADLTEINSRFAEYDSTIMDNNQRLAALERQLAAQPDASRLDAIEQRLADQEAREITLEAFNDGKLVGKSTGKSVLRFDVQTITGDN